MDGWMDHSPFGRENDSLAGSCLSSFLFLFFWAVLWLPFDQAHLTFKVHSCFYVVCFSLFLIMSVHSIWFWSPSKLDQLLQKLNIKSFHVPAAHYKVKVYSDPPRLEPNLSRRSCHRPPPPVPEPNFDCVTCDCSFHSTEDMDAHQCRLQHYNKNVLQPYWPYLTVSLDRMVLIAGKQV